MSRDLEACSEAATKKYVVSQKSCSILKTTEIVAVAPIMLGSVLEVNSKGITH